MMTVMNYFCRMVVLRKTSSLISSGEHCQRISPSQTSGNELLRDIFCNAEVSFSVIKASFNLTLTTALFNILTGNCPKRQQSVDLFRRVCNRRSRMKFFAKTWNAAQFWAQMTYPSVNTTDWICKIVFINFGVTGFFLMYQWKLAFKALKALKLSFLAVVSNVDGKSWPCASNFHRNSKCWPVHNNTMSNAPVSQYNQLNQTLQLI